MKEVYHKRYGKGVIISQKFGGFLLKVEFNDGIVRFVRSDEIEKADDQEIIQSHFLKHTIKIPENRFIARQAIESLRMGVFPFEIIEDFIIGRDAEIESIDSWLKDDEEGVLYLIGDYGSGKSHLLEYLRLTTLKKGWATSFVEIGLEENQFYKPFIIYNEMIRNFKIKINKEIIGFRQFIHLIKDSEKAEKFQTHKYFKILIQLLKANAEEEYFNKIWEWITGENDWFKPKLYKRGTAANIYCYLINAISYAVKEIFNLNGLLVLFDEAEIMGNYNYSYQKKKVLNFKEGLIRLSKNDKSLLSERISFLRYGVRTGLIYCKYPTKEQIRYAWKYPSNLKIIFAQTNFQNPYEINHSIELSEFGRQQYFLILNQIIKFYCKAYNLPDNKYDVDKIFEKIRRGKIRIYIKEIIELLDVLRFNPNKDIEDIFN